MDSWSAEKFKLFNDGFIMNLYRFLFLSICFVLCTTAKAAHIIGGNLSYECVGLNQYEFTITLYRDCNPELPNAADFDEVYALGVYDANGDFIEWIEFGNPVITLVNTDNGNPCLELPSTVCAQKGEYKVSYTLPNIHNGYLFNYQRCCRGAVINNILSPEAVGTTMYVSIPPSTIACNNSPQFSNTPPIALCLQNEEVLDLSATDADGDQLVYKLATPLEGLDPSSPQVDFITGAGEPTPFSEVTWIAPYSATQPFPSATPITLDPNTGILTATPTQEGFYVIGIIVEEYRGGVLINELIRDFRFTVADCGLPLANSPITDIYCDGLTVEFSNTSSNATSFEWDFGDLSTTDDVSTSETASYTYPGEGLYTIRLIASDGPDCVDTTFFDMNLYLEIDPEMILPESQCFDDNSFDFEVGGFFAPNSDIRWDFGPFAEPQFSNEIAPTGVSFTRGGLQNINLLVEIGNCSISLDGELLVGVEIPEIIETDPQIDCIPFTVNITPEEVSGDLIYSWDLGDGTIVNTPSVTHEYTTAGIYDIILTMTDPATGCTNGATFEQYVQAYNIPQAGFSIVEDTVRLFDEFNIQNEAAFGATYTYNFGDGAIINIENPKHTFLTEGPQTIIQTVENEGGCSDTFSFVVDVAPDYKLFIPTAFTPNNDGLNEFFRPYFIDINTYQLYIYDRWGKLIFDQIGDNPTWHGFAPDGSESPQGLYYYEILFVNGLNFPIKERGTISLIR